MFRRRLNILTFKGIPIGVDTSWFFIAVLVCWSLAAGYFPLQFPGFTPILYWSMGLAGMLGLFICIILHELGHALVATKYGVPVAQITLFIFGGVAELKKEATTPFVEFAVAVAGPVVSVVLAAIFYVATEMGILYGLPAWATGVTSYLWMINTLIVLFNLVPAFPLDGGRILRSIIWAKTKDLRKATKITTLMGSGFGFFLLVFGIINFFTGELILGVWFFILGLFLQRTAVLSQTRFCINEELKEEKVTKFMKTAIDGVSGSITVQDLIDHHLYQTHHHLYPVVEENRLTGYVNLSRIKEIPPEDRGRTLVRQVMLAPTEEQLISPTKSAMEALEQINASPFPTLFVIEGGKFIGLLTPQDLLKLVSLKLELNDTHK